MLTSITKIQKVYDTGQKPVLVQCNDLEFYVCKHNNGQRPAYVLFAEWISYKMLTELEVKLTTMELINIKEEHIEPTLICQPIYFKGVSCFGTQYLEEAVEWSQFPFSNKDAKKINNIADIFTIAFIDIWLANEDRSWNNFNLLLNPQEKGYDIVPIDYGACFNTRVFSEENSLDLIALHESIIDTEQFVLLACKTIKTVRDAANLAEKLYFRVKSLEKIYDEKALDIPDDWNIPDTYWEALKNNLFNEEWLSETKNCFLTFLKSKLNLK